MDRVFGRAKASVHSMRIAATMMTLYCSSLKSWMVQEPDAICRNSRLSS